MFAFAAIRYTVVHVLLYRMWYYSISFPLHYVTTYSHSKTSSLIVLQYKTNSLSTHTKSPPFENLPLTSLHHNHGHRPFSKFYLLPHWSIFTSIHLHRATYKSIWSTVGIRQKHSQLSPLLDHVRVKAECRFSVSSSSWCCEKWSFWISAFAWHGSLQNAGPISYTNPCHSNKKLLWINTPSIWST